MAGVVIKVGPYLGYVPAKMLLSLVGERKIRADGEFRGRLTRGLSGCSGCLGTHKGWKEGQESKVGK